MSGAAAELEPDVTAQPDPRQKGGTAYDPDGRRRVVLMGVDRRTLDRAIVLLKVAGLGMVIGCRSRNDGVKPCGQPMLLEGVDVSGLTPVTDPDAGYGCECTRVHFARD
jgi:hypothetical protein